jgi:DNA-binding Lrp family transcriptional regulator
MILDAIDRQVLLALFKDGRASLSFMSQSITKANNEKMSHAGISRRITKLENSDVLNIQGNLNINKLNYSVMFILMEMKNYNDIQNIIDMYSECPRIFLLAHVTGQYHLIFGVIGHDINDLREYINFCGPSNKRGVLHSEILYTSQLVAPKFIPINLFSGKSKEDKCKNLCKECSSYIEGRCKGCGMF